MKILPSCLVLALVAGPSAACGSGEAPAERTPITPSPERAALPAAVRAQLDSGNLAFREGDLDAAERHYRAVVEAEPDFAPGWFGISMVEQKRGNEEAAAEALERAGMPQPAPGQVHPGAGGEGLPSAHPPLDGVPAGRPAAEHPPVPASRQP